MRAHSGEILSEYLEAVSFYESQRPGRGSKFATAVGKTAALIGAHPLSFPRVRRLKGAVIRKARVVGWPHSLYYYVEPGGGPVAFALFSSKRGPAFVRGRFRRF